MRPHPHTGSQGHLALPPVQPHRQLPAEFFSVSQPTISRTINQIEKALMKILKPLIQPLEKALEAPGSLVVDGTLIHTWNWCSLGKTNFSGKHKRAGFNHQVICTLHGKLLAINAPASQAQLILR